MSKNKKRKTDNTMLWILIGILLVCFLMIGFLFYKYFYSGISTSKYGETRLEGIENYKLSDTLTDDIKEKYSDEGCFGEISTTVEGRIIYINLEYTAAVSDNTARDLALEALECIGEENLAYYEVQFILTFTGENEDRLPIFGAKNANSLKVVW